MKTKPVKAEDVIARRADAKRAAEHHKRLCAIRQAAAGVIAQAVTGDALLTQLWDTDSVDFDKWVDQYAKHHPAEGYRERDFQKDHLDGLADQLGHKLSAEKRAELPQIVDSWYSRCLTSADVGFELGFSAAQSLRGGGR